MSQYCPMILIGQVLFFAARRSPKPKTHLCVPIPIFTQELFVILCS
jgi:hypothetical protein